MRSVGSLAGGAGLCFVAVAMCVQGFLPALIPESRSRSVSRAVRTDLGDVKWVRYDASDYTPGERVGRDVYIREGCWYCHSQYVRPVAGEDRRWGPVSEAGEYAFDLPHLLSTRRIGPDLTRVGLKYGDDWHYAHLWDPRLVARDSVMPSFKWLYTQLRVRVRATDAGPSLAPFEGLGRYFTLSAETPISLYPNARGVTFVAPPANGRWPLDGTPVIDLRGAGERSPASVTLVLPKPELVGLVRYLQKLGTNRGIWRDVFEPQTADVSVVSIPRGQDVLALGREVYAARCVGCHGEDGDGNGPAATFLSPRPRDFTLGVFKFRSTPSGSLPTDGDLYRTVTRGLRSTAMPTWHELPDRDRLAVVAFIKTFSSRFKDEQPTPATAFGNPPRATAELVARGKDLYAKAQCSQCHGGEGRGDGFTRSRFKGGSKVSDIFRAVTFGLDGSLMPSFADSTNEEQRWAISYYVLSLSAWKDPLTGQTLDPSPAAREALDSSGVSGLALGELVVAISMSLAALCALVWGATIDAFCGRDQIARQVLLAEQTHIRPGGLAPGPGAGPYARRIGAEHVLIVLTLLNLLTLALGVLFNSLANFLPIAF
jgi:cytochrome c oxidase cbb3-type subunit 2